MFLVGDKVRIVAKGDFFAFVDGWRGTCGGMNNGLIVVNCQSEEGPKTFFVPPDQVVKTL